MWHQIRPKMILNRSSRDLGRNTTDVLSNYRMVTPTARNQNKCTVISNPLYLIRTTKPRDLHTSREIVVSTLILARMFSRTMVAFPSSSREISND